MDECRLKEMNEGYAILEDAVERLKAKDIGPLNTLNMMLHLMRTVGGLDEKDMYDILYENITTHRLFESGMPPKEASDVLRLLTGQAKVEVVVTKDVSPAPDSVQ